VQVDAERARKASELQHLARLQEVERKNRMASFVRQRHQDAARQAGAGQLDLAAAPARGAAPVLTGHVSSLPPY
jgi:hypothetical protein